MPLFVATVKSTRIINGIRFEKGMSVEIISIAPNPIFFKDGKEVTDAFMRKYGIDLKKIGGPAILNLDLQKLK